METYKVAVITGEKKIEILGLIELNALKKNILFNLIKIICIQLT